MVQISIQYVWFSLLWRSFRCILNTNMIFNVHPDSIGGKEAGILCLSPIRKRSKKTHDQVIKLCFNLNSAEHEILKSSYMYILKKLE